MDSEDTKVAIEQIWEHLTTHAEKLNELVGKINQLQKLLNKTVVIVNGMKLERKS